MGELTIGIFLLKSALSYRLGLPLYLFSYSPVSLFLSPTSVVWVIYARNRYYLNKRTTHLS